MSHATGLEPQKKASKMKPHKHAEVIKAWADGAIIEFWFPGEKDWITCIASPGWSTEQKYRVKPNPVTVTYQVALMRKEDQYYMIYSREGEELSNFVRWLVPPTTVEVE